MKQGHECTFRDALIRKLKKTSINSTFLTFLITHMYRLLGMTVWCIRIRNKEKEDLTLRGSKEEDTRKRWDREEGRV